MQMSFLLGNNKKTRLHEMSEIDVRFSSKRIRVSSILYIFIINKQMNIPSPEANRKHIITRYVGFLACLSHVDNKYEIAER